MSRYGPVGIGGFNPQRSDSFGHPPSDRSGGGGRDNRYSDRDFARDGGHRGGELGRGGRGRGGGRGAGRGGGGAWPDRQGLESKGINIMTNCFRIETIEPLSNTNLHQYQVQIDPMKWMYGEKGERTDLVVDDMRNSFFRQQDDDDDAEKNALTNRSSVLSRRILNNCQTDREANSQFFVSTSTGRILCNL